MAEQLFPLSWITLSITDSKLLGRHTLRRFLPRLRSLSSLLTLTFAESGSLFCVGSRTRVSSFIGRRICRAPNQFVGLDRVHRAFWFQILLLAHLSLVFTTCDALRSKDTPKPMVNGVLRSFVKNTEHSSQHQGEYPLGGNIRMINLPRQLSSHINAF